METGVGTNMRPPGKTLAVRVGRRGTMRHSVRSKVNKDQLRLARPLREPRDRHGQPRLARVALSMANPKEMARR